ncbi:hypothetical protein Aperf_G00000110227 [Anoplocephala perfoliata]
MNHFVPIRTLVTEAYKGAVVICEIREEQLEPRKMRLTTTLALVCFYILACIGFSALAYPGLDLDCEDDAGYFHDDYQDGDEHYNDWDDDDERGEGDCDGNGEFDYSDLSGYDGDEPCDGEDEPCYYSEVDDYPGDYEGFDDEHCYSDCDDEVGLPCQDDCLDF